MKYTMKLKKYPYKIKLEVKGYFWLFTIVFFIITQLTQEQFHIWLNKKKVGVHGRHMCLSSGAYSASQCPKLPFYYAVGSITMYSSCWCNVSPLVVWFGDNKNFFPSLPPNIVVWPSWLLTFQLQFLLFWFLIFGIGSFVKVLFVFNFIIQSQFTKYYILQNAPHFLDF
jgi:hypothetical protein